MEERESKSQSPQKDSQFILKKFFAEDAEGLKERIDEIRKETKQNGKFSKLTAEECDQKMSYLKRNLLELSLMDNILTDIIDSRISSGFDVSKAEDLKSDFRSDSLISTNDLLISTDNVDSRKDKETETSDEVLLQKTFNLDEDKELVIEPLTTDRGNEKANEIEIQYEVSDLKYEVADLQHALSDSYSTIKKLKDELEISKKKATFTDKVIEGLKEQRSKQDSKEKAMEQELHRVQKILDGVKSAGLVYDERIVELQDQIADYKLLISDHEEEIDELDKKNKQHTSEIAELQKKNKQNTSEIAQLKSLHKKKENNWITSIAKLRKKLEDKGELVNDLTKKLESVQAEKCSQDNVIQELETRLKSLLADHEGLLTSSEKAQKVMNKLTERVLELEREVNMQMEVSTVKDEEKREAVRQLSYSLEYYQSRYEEIRKAFVSKNRISCFDFFR